MDPLVTSRRGGYELCNKRVVLALNNAETIPSCQQVTCVTEHYQLLASVHFVLFRDPPQKKRGGAEQKSNKTTNCCWFSFRFPFENPQKRGGGSPPQNKTYSPVVRVGLGCGVSQALQLLGMGGSGLGLFARAASVGCLAAFCGRVGSPFFFLRGF